LECLYHHEHAKAVKFDIELVMEEKQEVHTCTYATSQLWEECMPDITKRLETAIAEMSNRKVDLKVVYKDGDIFAKYGQRR